MIRHTRRASVLIAFCVLTSAATASAECAWVLWTERPTRSDQWRNEVEAKALGAAQKQRRTPEPSALYTCFPDTVDPRGSKGK